LEITGPKRINHQARPLRFIELDTGCYVPVSHKLNPDGYFRKLWGNYRSKQTHEMFHRFIWRAHNGPIPDGHEIDHLCGVRCCCNLKHLACLEGSAHTIKGNRNRYSMRKQAAKEFW
jgi:hypothetical protein